MNNPFRSGIGIVMSADIAVPQHERLTAFYAAVLTTGTEPLWHADLMNNFGLPIIGLGQENAEYTGLPLQWMPHIQVTDIAHSVKQALAHGGRELLHGKNQNGESQWAVLEDPNGAAFGLIPVVDESILPVLDAQASAHMGCIAWLDLTVENAAATCDFYQNVVGWRVEEVPMTDGHREYSDYNMLDGDGQAVAGICHAVGVNQEVPPVWMLYLPVADLKASVKQVKQLGGEVIQANRNNQNELTQVLIQDPIGVSLCLAQT